MKRSVKLQPSLGDAVVVLVVLVLMVVFGVSVWTQGEDSGELTAVVSIDGVETERVVLSEAEQRTYTGNGYTLQVLLSESGAEVQLSDCPTQDCVHTGTITRAGQSIVCLPARIIIALEGASVESDAPDLVIG